MLRTALAIALASTATPALSQQKPAAPAWPDQKESDFLVKDFRFQGGGLLPELRLHYLTLGTPRRDGAGRVTNAVLLLHGTTGSGKNFLAPGIAGELFGPGQPLDASRHYIILPDGLGRGGSTKPSDGLRAKFPRYGYHDVVAAHHLLVTQGLHVDHLRLVLGTSMGGMQTYLWGERYPEMMDGLVAISSQPIQIAGRNLLWRRMITEAIRNDPDWNGGDYLAQPRRWALSVPVFAIMTTGPVRLQEQGPTREAAGALFERLVDAARKNDANDYLYWFESSWDYDPEPDLGKIRAPLLAVNFGADLINAEELGVMDRLVKRIPRGRSVVIPARDHQTQSQASVWKPHLEELLRTLP